ARSPIFPSTGDMLRASRWVPVSPQCSLYRMQRVLQRLVWYNRGKGVCLSKATQELPRTLGALRQSSYSEAKLANRSVKDELRNNLICKIQRGEELFPGILGYEDTVIPQVVNAVLSRHNFILLGLRGQAKTRLIRMLTNYLDEWAPYVEGCEIHDNPYHPICRRCR